MGKFVLKETNTGFKFDLKASNGQTIGVSQVYASKESAKQGIESVRKNAAEADIEDQTLEENKTNPKFELYLDKAGEFRFRLMARNGQNILSSEGYKSKASCSNGIESVITNAAEGNVEEELT